MQRLGSFADLAREVKLTRQAISKAAKANRITVFPDGSVDLDVAAAQLSKNTDPTQRERSLGQNRARDGAARADVSNAAAENGDAVSYSSARTRRENADAQRSELELDRMRGTLANRAALITEFTNHVVTARQLLQAMSARLAPMVAAEDDSKKCASLIDAEVRRVCAELSTHEGLTQ